ncbi:MAG: acyl-CoA synthetase [Acidimicrobiales bacterium]|jgi:long-chain acyl-CoA synthetase|nr:acyl-CoA synthetase [Acidimicrobiales bacterium]
MTAGVCVHAEDRPDHPALLLGLGPDARRTFAELDDRARRVADALAGFGVGDGDCVAVVLSTSVEWFEVVHGCGRLGAVAVPVNIHFKSAETGWILSDSAAKAVVAGAGFTDDGGLPRLTVGEDYEAALAAASPVDRRAQADAWPTTMVYTSGTTGRPKGVVPGPDDIRRTAAGMVMMTSRFGLGPDDVHLMVGPAYHSGPSAWAQSHLAMGATVALLPAWDAEGCLAMIERHRVTNTHMVPANFIRILDLPPDVRERYDLSSLRMAIHAAAPCPVPVKRAFMDFVGPEKVWEYFGATEGGGTSISPEEWLRKPGSVGKAFPGNEVVILDDDGKELPPGAVGLVYVRPASAPFRYHNDNEKTASAFRGGRFTVGDMGYLDDEGYLFLTDRRADMVITGGVNVYPREVEDVLYLHPDLADCVVFGVPDDRWGESLVAVVQRRAGASMTADDVVSWCRERLADYKRPRAVEFVDELPRDPNGKIRKPQMKQEWLAEQEKRQGQRGT